MKVLLGLFGGGLVCVVLTGCAGLYSAPVVPPKGWLFTNYRAPLDTDYKETRLGKVGVSSSQCVLGLVSWGDASTEAAARENNITTINHADHEFLNVLGIYSRYTTIIYGE